MRPGLRCCAVCNSSFLEKDDTGALNHQSKTQALLLFLFRRASRAALLDFKIFLTAWGCSINSLSLKPISQSSVLGSAVALCGGVEISRAAAVAGLMSDPFQLNIPFQAMPQTYKPLHNTLQSGEPLINFLEALSKPQRNVQTL